MGLSIFDESLAVFKRAELLPADATDEVTVFESLSAQIRIDALLISSTAIASHDVTLSLSDNYTSYAPIATVSVPAGAGSGSIPIVDLVPSLPVPIGAVILPPRTEITLRCAVTLGSGEALTIAVLGGLV